MHRLAVPTRLVLLAAAASALVGWISLGRGLQFVDVIGFSGRARLLAEGRPPLDGLYPLGYPAILALGHALGFAIFPVAKVLSGLAGVGLVVAVGARFGVLAAGWLLVQVPLLQWAGTEGTDLLAASLSLGAVLASRRPIPAGLLLGAALSVRWTAIAWVPALWLAVGPGERLRAAGAVLLGTLPHWLACAWCGTLVLPSQEMNLLIAAGRGGPPRDGSPWVASLIRLPDGVLRALPHAFPDWPARVSLVVLACGLLPRESRRLSAALLLGLILHLVALGAVFANLRLALPATLAALVGAGAVVATLFATGGPVATGRPVATGGAVATTQRARTALAAVVVGVLALVAWSGVPSIRKPSIGETALQRLADTLDDAGVSREVPLLSNSAWAHSVSEGWLVPSVQLTGRTATPRTTPAELCTFAERNELAVLVLDTTRGRRGLEGLGPLFEAKQTEVQGWTLGSAAAWRVWERTADSPCLATLSPPEPSP